MSPMATDRETKKEREDWQRILREEDEVSFNALVEPYIGALNRAARHYLNYYVAQGHIPQDAITVEDVVGETLVRAWNFRSSRPEKMPIRAWLLATLYRVVRSMVMQERAYRRENAISLDEPIPINPQEQATQEHFWEWYQWDDQLDWQDVIPNEVPVDYEVSLYDSEATAALDPDTYHVLMMHDEFEMSLPDVAFTMNRAVNEVAELLDMARADLRERLAGGATDGAIDHPAPPRERN